MAYVISSECLSCGSCVDECPNNCIEAGDSIYVINAADCIDCGACSEACPVSAISPQ